MEDRSFDELSKKLALPISRRSALKAFTASIAGALLVGVDRGRALADDKKCSGFGDRCNPGHDCCGGTGLICDQTGPGVNGTCACPAGQVFANGVCRAKTCSSAGPQCGAAGSGCLCQQTVDDGLVCAQKPICPTPGSANPAGKCFTAANCNPGEVCISTTGSPGGPGCCAKQCT